LAALYVLSMMGAVHTIGEELTPQSAAFMCFCTFHPQSAAFIWLCTFRTAELLSPQLLEHASDVDKSSRASLVCAVKKFDEAFANEGVDAAAASLRRSSLAERRMVLNMLSCIDSLIARLRASALRVVKDASEALFNEAVADVVASLPGLPPDVRRAALNALMAIDGIVAKHAPQILACIFDACWGPTCLCNAEQVVPNQLSIAAQLRREKRELSRSSVVDRSRARLARVAPPRRWGREGVGHQARRHRD